MSKDLTPWFPPEIKPVHVGIYAATVCPDTMPDYYRYWNGERFMACCDVIEIAFENRHHEALCQQDWIFWRGISEKPE